jgi:phosphatase NudJ
MFKPHVTVACVVHAQDKFLIVEETINGKALWNQPAGHLEANETLLQAAERELWEETGIRATPQHFIRMHQWIAPDNTPFLRFLFAIELSDRAPLNRMTAISIAACGSVLTRFLTRQTCARRWLPKAFAATCRTRGSRCR